MAKKMPNSAKSSGLIPAKPTKAYPLSVRKRARQLCREMMDRKYPPLGSGNAVLKTDPKMPRATTEIVTDEKGRTLGDILDWYARAERGELDVQAKRASTSSSEFPLPISEQQALAWIKKKLADAFDVVPMDARLDQPAWHLFRITKCSDRAGFEGCLAVHATTGKIRSLAP